VENRYRVITLMGGADAHPTRELYQAISDAGYTIAREDHVSCASDQEPPFELVCWLKPEQEQQLRSHGIRYLGDFSAFSFKDVWFWLGGDELSGHHFYKLCERLIIAKVSFADFNPVSVADWKPEDWRAHGLDGAVSGILMRLGIRGEQMLVAFTADELADIRGIGHGKRLAALTALQQKFRQPRTV
jgi:hypothetical protein